MKIVISGAFCTGKTTLFQSISQTGLFSSLIPDQSREFKEHFTFVNWSDQRTRAYLFLQQCFEEAKRDEDGRPTLCDCGIVECLAHSKVLTPGIDLRDMMKFHRRRYDVVLICDPGDMPLVDDGLRHTNTNLRLTIHQTILDIYRSLGYEAVPVNGNGKERLNIAMKAIHSC